MSEELFNCKKVSFSKYLNNDGRIIKTLGFSLNGESLLFHNLPLKYRNNRAASVGDGDGELYFVPFDSLVF